MLGGPGPTYLLLRSTGTPASPMPDAPLPGAVASGAEPFMTVGALAGVSMIEGFKTG